MKFLALIISLLLILTFAPHIPVKALDNDLIPDHYIIVMKNNVDIAKAYGLTKTHEYKHTLNAVAVKATKYDIDNIKHNSNVLFIEQDRIMSIQQQILPTGVDRIDAELNPISKIDGIDERVDADIAILDTGVYQGHEDLYLYRACNFLGSANCSGGWTDQNGHGTHVAGIAAAKDNGIGVVGVAPGARIWVGTVLDNLGSGSLSDIIEGIDWVTANSSEVDVVNMSLGGSGSDDGNCGLTNNDAFHLAICNSVAKGVVYVVAAGNGTTDASTSVPAAYDEVITVSAIADFDGKGGGLASPTCRTDQDDTLADFSNYGVDVDIAAPGVCIYSTWLMNTYKIISGTSMAAPHVTGSVALLIAANGKPTNSTGVALVKQALIALGTPQADPNGFTGDKDAFPEPLLNASASTITLPAPIPTPTPNPTPIPPLVDTIPPTVTITNPKDSQTVVNHVYINVDASDNIKVAKIELYIDGALKATSSTDNPLVYRWNVKSPNSVGEHTITAIAYDTSNNTATQTIKVSVVSWK